MKSTWFANSRLMAAAMVVLCFLLIPRADAGVNQWSSNGPAAPLDSMAVAPSDPLTIYAGSHLFGTFRSTDGGSTWSLVNALGSPLTSLPQDLKSVDPRSKSTVYSTNPLGQVGVSTDGGGAWSSLPAFFAVSGSFAQDPQAPATMYAGTFGDGIIKSTDGGTTGFAVNSGLPGSSIQIVSIAMNPTSTGTVYASVTASDSSLAGIYRTTDGGGSWVQVFADEVPVISIAIAPSDPQTVYALDRLPATGSLVSHIYVSTDGGTSWSNPNPGLCCIQGYGAIQPFTSIAIDPHDPQTFYLGTAGTGVFVGHQMGQDIQPFWVGLFGFNVSTMAYDSSGATLHAATDTGIFDYRLQLPGGCVPDANTLCLNNLRFQVQTSWTDFQGHNGLGTVAGGGTPDSGSLWFFAPTNVELLIKVLNGCGVNRHYWVFGAAATNVEYSIQVTDTQTGEIRTYTNPLGTVSPAITDTAAFASCP
jgi:hypothetical protein